jgi:ribosomal protein S12 methylthiotransferase
MLGLLEKAGYQIVNDPSKSDILIVNTCGFIEDAKRESIESILDMARFKGAGKAKYLIVTGCLPQRYREELVNLFPEVDLFVGTGEYHQIAQLLKKLENGKGKSHHIGIPEYIYTAKTPRIVTTAKHAAYIKIAEGCFHACSFCTIPKVRGKYRSRAVKDIVSEAKKFIKNGTKELNFIAQDTTAYGRDLGDGNIVTLLENLIQISGEKWIRLLYMYPQSFKKGIIKLMRESSDICKYIDMPIQHIDDKILFNMRRGRSEKKIRNIVDYVKSKIPEVSLRTSVITGFPGETERQFKKLLDFISEGHFDHVGVFTYSEEEGTLAAKMKKHLPEKVKRARMNQIMKAQKRVSKKRLKCLVGTRLKVLVEGAAQETEHLIQARAEFQAPDIDGVVYINEGKARVGEFYWVEVTETYDYDIIGKVI